MASPLEPPWRLVVPVKGGAAAKSRLHPPAGVPRRALALALATDCLRAACTALPPARVTVVTSDADVAAVVAALGSVVVPDPGEGLDAAVEAGLDAVDLARGSRPEGVAVLLGDVPALRPDDLAAALGTAAAYPRVVVPDAEATGTVLLAARSGRPVPRFGAGSAARHERAGHVRLELDLPRLRTDVDDDRSLAAARALGVGPATAAILAGAAGATLPDVQASVHTFDEESGSGTALLDDGREVSFAAEVFAASALRHLRPGQRVSIDLDPAAGAVTRLWIVGIGDDQRIG
ncbi:MAG TPA: 2-phospho-L-lactate guanylyltransferase [Pedococcus sp.]